MTHRITLLAGAAALAFAGPASAQTAGSGGPGSSASTPTQTWQEISRPNIRFVQRGADGSILFDSQAANDAPGASDEALAEAIEAADGATPGATDPAAPTVQRPGDQADPMMDGTTPREAASAAAGDMAVGGSNADRSADMGSDRAAGDATAAPDGTVQAADVAHTERTPMAVGAAETAAPGSLAAEMGEAMGGESAETTAAAAPTAGMAGGDRETAPQSEADRQEMDAGGADAAGSTDRPMADRAQAQEMASDDAMRGQVPGAGVPFDVEEFAEEMFEQGYRRGYVNGVTQVRADMTRRMRDGERMRADRPMRQRGGDARAAAPQALTDGQGNTVIVLPQGMSPQQFLEQLSQQRR